MQKFLKEYLEGLNERRAKRRKIRIAELLLVVLVIGTVAGVLSQYGLTLTDAEKCGLAEHKHNGACYENRLVCGKEETEAHEHTDECYETADILVCGLDETEGHQHDESCYDEEGNLVCEKKEMEPHHHDESCYTEEHTLICQEKSGESHTHTDECYERTLICGMEEHEHDASCYIDKTADVEEPSVWDDMYANTEWRDTWSENLVIAAEKQLAYKESKDNYEVAEDGSHKGYTRYGAFCEDDYCDWDAAFVNFCMHYAGKDDINIEASKMFPKETDAQKWYDEFVKADEGNKDFLMAPAGYEPKAGDLIFFEQEDEDAPLRMGIVSDYDAEKNEFSVIEGNRTDEVKENTYKIKKQAQGISEETATVDVVLAGTVAEEETVVALLDMMAVEEAYKASPEAYSDEAEEEIRELTTDVDDTTITLSGPVSSFEEGVEYTLQAEKVENEETIATVEEAVNQVAEEKEKEVDSYQAFDIKLMVDGEEVQPLGPVEVKFSGREVAKAVEDEETEVNVIHVDENTGDVEDMEAVATESSEVVIETEHFSVYVYVHLTEIFGKINIKVEHWGKDIKTISGTAVAKIGEDAVFDKSKKEVITKGISCPIYSADTIEIPNEYYASIEKLSKVCNVSTEAINYDISEIWITSDAEIYGDENVKEQEEWPEGTYVICKKVPEGATKGAIQVSGEAINYNLASTGGIQLQPVSGGAVDSVSATAIKLSNNSRIRFWYTPKEENDQFSTPVVFYDYDLTTDGSMGTGTTDSELYLFQEKDVNADRLDVIPRNGTVTLLHAVDKDWYKARYNNKEGYVQSSGLKKITINGNEQGINASANFGSGGQRLGAGQMSSGNRSSWASTAKGGGQDNTKYYLNRAQDKIEINGEKRPINNNVAEGIVGTELTSDGKPDFRVNASSALFADGSGSTVYDGVYQLRFHQNGDTYTLQNVYKPAEDRPVTGDLTQFSKYSTVYSNNFWPMDDVYNTDPHMSSKKERYYYGSGLWDYISPSDDGLDHNWHFGMQYEIQFTVGAYEGPMEYYFRGDDDFWLYIDGQLAVDIGGIHPSVGQSLDLRKWMEERDMLKDPNQEHSLKVFYMERGGFGSCCYMQFTLPNSVPVEIPVPETTEYEVEKKWDDDNNPFRPESITVELQQKDDEGNVTGTDRVVLKAENDWKYKWTGLPKINGSKGENYIYTYEAREIGLPAGYKSELSSDGVLTNTLRPIALNVKKEWGNIDGAEKYLPESVTLRLYVKKDAYSHNTTNAAVEVTGPAVEDKDAGGSDGDAEYVPYVDKNGNYREVTLNAENGWEGVFTDIPEYSYLPDPKGKKIEYAVREVVNGVVVEEGGTVSGAGISNAAFTVTYGAISVSGDAIDVTGSAINASGSAVKGTLLASNTLHTGFQIVKRANFKGQLTEEGAKPLEGAEFTLTSGSAQYTGKSDENGIIVWRDSFGKAEIQPGTYVLKETKAPTGYTLSTDEWSLTVHCTGETTRVSIHKINGSGEPGAEITPTTVVTEDGTVMFSYTFFDEMLYELPAAGGSGIHMYMFSGVLLMFTAFLLAYKNKRKEVLRR